MEDQPAFFFNQSEQDDFDASEEYEESNVEVTSKKKKKKSKEFWAKLFESKETKPIKEEHKSFTETFSKLFGKLTGIEKEEITDDKIKTSQTIGSLGIGTQLIDRIETPLANSVDDQRYNEQSTTISSEVVSNDIESTNYSNSNQTYGNGDINNDIEQFNLSQIQNKDNSNGLEFSVGSNDSNDQPKFDARADQTNPQTNYQIPKEITEAEIDTLNTDSPTDRGVENPKFNQFKTKEVGASLLGNVVAEELSKSNSTKLKKQAEKMKKSINTSRRSEEKTMHELAELKNKQKRQQTELMYKRFREEQSELPKNSQDSNRENLRKIVQDQKSNKPEEDSARKRVTEQSLADTKQKYYEIEQKMHQDQQKYEKDKTQNNKEMISAQNDFIIEQSNFEGRYVTEQEQDKQQEKFKAKKSLIKDEKLASNNHGAEDNPKMHQNQRVTHSKQIVDNQNSMASNNVLKTDDYKVAVKQGFTAGIIVLVSFMIVVIIWSLLN